MGLQGYILASSKLYSATDLIGNPDHLRTGCDLMNFFFVVDEYTDVEDASGVRQMVDIVMDALKNSHKPRPEGEMLLGEMARQ